MPTEATSARELLGMPVPPVWAVRAAALARSGVGHVHARMSPPFQLVLDRMLGAVDAHCLAAAVALGIPDALADGPADAAELAARIHPGTDADALGRLLLYLVTRDVFRVDGDGRFANDAVADQLRRDADPCWRDWVRFLGSPWANDILGRLDERVRTGRPATEVAFGLSFFDHLDRDPEAAEAFHGAMAAGSRIQGAVFAEAVDLTGVTSVCDVGGGTGTAAVHLARLHPGLRATVLDLSSLAEGAAEVTGAADLGGRVTFEAGDFFTAVPGGHDLYTLFAVIHDWGDDDAVRILRSIRNAMPATSRVMIVDQVLPEPGRAGFARATDMLMLAFGDGGRERTVEEFRSLARRAGLRVVRTTTLPSLFEVIELRPDGRRPKEATDDP